MAAVRARGFDDGGHTQDSGSETQGAAALAKPRQCATECLSQHLVNFMFQGSREAARSPKTQQWRFCSWQLFGPLENAASTFIVTVLVPTT